MARWQDAFKNPEQNYITAECVTNPTIPSPTILYIAAIEPHLYNYHIIEKHL